MTLDEKKEIVVNSYSNTFDRDMAYLKAGLTDDEIDKLESDSRFQNRLQYHLIDEREVIIKNFRVFMNSEDEKIALSATKDLAKMIYPDFVDGIRKDKKKKPTRIKDLEMRGLSDDELMEIANQNKHNGITNDS